LKQRVAFTISFSLAFVCARDNTMDIQATPEDVLKLKLRRACEIARHTSRIAKMLLLQINAAEEKKEVVGMRM
jgi:hypothetical protein